MEEALRFFRTYEVWIYLLLGLGGVIYLRKFVLAWQELRGAGFGLERDSAQARLNQAASVMVLVLTMVVMEFVLVSFIAPAFPGAEPLPTPTLDLLATSTITLAAPPSRTPDFAFETAVAQGTPLEPLLETAAAQSALLTPGGPGLVGVGTPLPATLAPASGCLPGLVAIAVPVDGQEIRGSVEISGTVNTPDFGFYKFEMRLQDAADWLTILAGNQPKQDAVLGTWNTSLLPPGSYQLGLVVTDNTGKSLPPCIVSVLVAPPLETPNP